MLEGGGGVFMLLSSPLDRNTAYGLALQYGCFDFTCYAT